MKSDSFGISFILFHIGISFSICLVPGSQEPILARCWRSGDAIWIWVRWICKNLEKASEREEVFRPFKNCVKLRGRRIWKELSYAASGWRCKRQFDSRIPGSVCDQRPEFVLPQRDGLKQYFVDIPSDSARITRPIGNGITSESHLVA
jgi:hypothetical protein